jgi:hypothetical protein
MGSLDIELSCCCWEAELSHFVLEVEARNYSTRWNWRFASVMRVNNQRSLNYFRSWSLRNLYLHYVYQMFNPCVTVLSTWYLSHLFVFVLIFFSPIRRRTGWPWRSCNVTARRCAPKLSVTFSKFAVTWKPCRTWTLRLLWSQRSGMPPSTG